MTVKFTLATIAALSIGAAALAHNGATGIVLEWMQGMSVMKDALKTLTPIMRGQVDYDAAAVRAAAEAIGTHAGDNLTALFPEDGSREKSYARDAIWTDWEGFSDLATRLETLSRGLEAAADNGLAAGGDARDSATMMGGSSAMMGGASNDASAMMGGGGTMGGGDMMGGAPMQGPLDLASLAGLPADEIFTGISRTCSACHSRFRVEQD